MRYLGIDYGSKKIGLALSDEAGKMGFPHSIVSNTPALIDKIIALIAKEKVGAVVVGESKDFLGKDNVIAANARALGDQVASRASVPIFYEPETFTSAEARRQHEPQEKTRAQRESSPVDASAAALILTSFLSRTAR